MSTKTKANKTKIRVLHVMAYPLNHLGGVESYVKNLILNTNKYGIYNEVVTTDLNNRFNHVENQFGIKVNLLKNYGMMWGKNPKFEVISFILKNKKRFDIIHIHSYIYFSSFQAILISKLLHIPIILTLHGGVQTKKFKAKTKSEKLQLFFKNYIYDKLWGHFVLKAPNIVSSVSKKDLELIGSVFNVSRSENYWIPNAVNPEIFKKGMNLEKKYISFIARLSFVKGFDLFIQLMEKINEKIPNIPILVLGNGEYKPLIEKSNLNITYLYNIPLERLIEIYNSTKLLVMTSRYEGLPTIILEAMSCQVPIISSDVGGISEIIKDKTTGYILDLDDLNSAANNIIQIINEPDQTEKITRTAYDLIQKKFSWDHVSKQIYQLYKKLVN